jgi:hypothetical protein
MKMYGGMEVQHIFLTSALDGCVVIFMAQPLYSWGKSFWYPLERRLGGSQSWSGHGGKETKKPAPARNQTLIIQDEAQSLHGL